MKGSRPESGLNDWEYVRAKTLSEKPRTIRLPVSAISTLNVGGFFRKASDMLRLVMVCWPTIDDDVVLMIMQRVYPRMHYSCCKCCPERYDILGSQGISRQLPCRQEASFSASSQCVL